MATGGQNKLSTDEVIQRIKKVHGNNFDTSKIVYVNSKTKILIGCKNHSKTFWYEANPGPLFKGVGCPKCGIKKIWKTRKRITTLDFIKKAKKIHGEKYDYSQSKYISAKQKVKVICKIHGEFKVSPNNHYKGNGCYECGMTRSKKSRLKGLDYFIIKSKIYHGDKYDYSHVKYTSSRLKVKIICPKHGGFFQSLQSHAKGHGCDKCAREYRTINHPRRLGIDTFFKRCEEVWGDDYDFSKIKTYVNNSTKVKVVCKKHGEFLITPAQLMTGHGCYECGLDRISDFQRIEYEEFLQMVEDVWGDKYMIGKDCYNSYQSFRVFCKAHDYYWETNGTNFLRGHGCRKCGFSVSKGETAISKILEKNKIPFFEQYSFFGMKSKRKLRCDFFLPNHNLVIEYNGRQHYEAIKFFGGIDALNTTKKRDMIKYNYCIDNNINYEILKYNESVDKRMREILLNYQPI